MIGKMGCFNYMVLVLHRMLILYTTTTVWGVVRGGLVSNIGVWSINVTRT